MNIYVGKMSREVTKDDLLEAFEEFGQVESVKIITDRVSGESKGRNACRQWGSPSFLKAVEVEGGDSSNPHSDIPES